MKDSWFRVEVWCSEFRTSDRGFRVEDLRLGIQERRIQR